MRRPAEHAAQQIIVATCSFCFVRFWAVAGLCVALLLPLLLTNFWTGIANQVFIATICEPALNLLMGTTGQISLGHAGFLEAGAFWTSPILGTRRNLS